MRRPSSPMQHKPPQSHRDVTHTPTHSLATHSNTTSFHNPSTTTNSPTTTPSPLSTPPPTQPPFHHITFMNGTPVTQVRSNPSVSPTSSPLSAPPPLALTDHYTSAEHTHRPPIRSDHLLNSPSLPSLPSLLPPPVHPHPHLRTHHHHVRQLPPSPSSPIPSHSPVSPSPPIHRKHHTVLHPLPQQPPSRSRPPASSLPRRRTTSCRCCSPCQQQTPLPEVAFEDYIHSEHHLHSANLCRRSSYHRHHHHHLQQQALPHNHTHHFLPERTHCLPAAPPRYPHATTCNAYDPYSATAYHHSSCRQSLCHCRHYHYVPTSPPSPLHTTAPIAAKTTHHHHHTQAGDLSTLAMLRCTPFQTPPPQPRHHPEQQQTRPSDLRTMTPGLVRPPHVPRLENLPAWGEHHEFEHGGIDDDDTLQEGDAFGVGEAVPPISRLDSLSDFHSFPSRRDVRSFMPATPVDTAAYNHYHNTPYVELPPPPPLPPILHSSNLNYRQQLPHQLHPHEEQVRAGRARSLSTNSASVSMSMSMSPSASIFSSDGEGTSTASLSMSTASPPASPPPPPVSPSSFTSSRSPSSASSPALPDDCVPPQLAGGVGGGGGEGGFPVGPVLPVAESGAGVVFEDDGFDGGARSVEEDDADTFGEEYEGEFYEEGEDGTEETEEDMRPASPLNYFIHNGLKYDGDVYELRPPQERSIASRPERVLEHKPAPLAHRQVFNRVYSEGTYNTRPSSLRQPAGDVGAEAVMAKGGLGGTNVVGAVGGVPGVEALADVAADVTEGDVGMGVRVDGRGGAQLPLPVTRPPSVRPETGGPLAPEQRRKLAELVASVKSPEEERKGEAMDDGLGYVGAGARSDSGSWLDLVAAGGGKGSRDDDIDMPVGAAGCMIFSAGRRASEPQDRKLREQREKERERKREARKKARAYTVFASGTSKMKHGPVLVGKSGKGGSLGQRRGSLWKLLSR